MYWPADPKNSYIFIVFSPFRGSYLFTILQLINDTLQIALTPWFRFWHLPRNGKFDSIGQMQHLIVTMKGSPKMLPPSNKLLVLLDTMLLWIESLISPASERKKWRRFCSVDKWNDWSVWAPRKPKTVNGCRAQGKVKQSLATVMSLSWKEQLGS